MSSLRRAVLVVILAGVCYGQEYVWVEGERPAGSSFEWVAAGVERSELLSGERWLLGKERQNLPDDGWAVWYDVDITSGGEYEVWLRVGFEWIRAAVAWRFDEGEWTKAGIGYKARGDEQKKLEGRGVPDIDRRTTNVKYVGVWNEVAW